MSFLARNVRAVARRNAAPLRRYAHSTSIELAPKPSVMESSAYLKELADVEHHAVGELCYFGVHLLDSDLLSQKPPISGARSGLFFSSSFLIRVLTYLLACTFASQAVSFTICAINLSLISSS